MHSFIPTLYHLELGQTAITSVLDYDQNITSWIYIVEVSLKCFVILDQNFWLSKLSVTQFVFLLMPYTVKLTVKSLCDIVHFVVAELLNIIVPFVTVIITVSENGISNDSESELKMKLMQRDQVYGDNVWLISGNLFVSNYKTKFSVWLLDGCCFLWFLLKNNSLTLFIKDFERFN